MLNSGRNGTRARAIAEPLNDGVVVICSVKNIAEAGNQPKDGLITKHKLRYRERTVGFKRFFTAMAANVSADRLIRCPRRNDVNVLDVAVIDGGVQYEIVQVQYPEDAEPPMMDLTLSKKMLKDYYEVKP